MTQSSKANIGERIAVARRRRGISRKALAEVVGRSEEWLRQIENGQRRLDSIEYATRLGTALRVSDLSSFLGIERSTRLPSMAAAEMQGPLREALMDSVLIQAHVPAAIWEEAAHTLDSDVDQARTHWVGGADRYHRTIQILPRLVCGAAARLFATNEPQQSIPAIAAYHLARTLFSRLGEEQFAWLVADRALTAAQRIGGTSILAAAWHLSACYLAQDAYQQASQFAMSAARRYADVDGEEGRALVGALHLVAAEAAAAMLDTPRASRLLDQANAAAAESGETFNRQIVPFGPSEANICAVRVAVRLGRHSEALRLAAAVDLSDDYLPDGQARHYIQLAHLYSRRNDDPAAVFALTKVAEISPEDVRYDRLSQEVLNRLLRRNNLTVRRELGRLARTAGIV